MVLGLPGNPTSALVAARSVPRAAIAAHERRRSELRIVLAGGLAGRGGFRRFAIARPSRAHAGPETGSCRSDQDSGAQRALAAAELLVRRGIGAPARVAGETVDVLDFQARIISVPATGSTAPGESASGYAHMASDGGRRGGDVERVPLRLGHQQRVERRFDARRPATPHKPRATRPCRRARGSRTPSLVAVDPDAVATEQKLLVRRMRPSCQGSNPATSK